MEPSFSKRNKSGRFQSEKSKKRVFRQCFSIKHFNDQYKTPQESTNDSEGPLIKETGVIQRFTIKLNNDESKKKQNSTNDVEGPKTECTQNDSNIELDNEEKEKLLAEIRAIREEALSGRRIVELLLYDKKGNHRDDNDNTNTSKQRKYSFVESLSGCAMGLDLARC